MATSSDKPFCTNTPVDLDRMTLDDFKLWSTPALKAYLSLRKKTLDGSFEELAARAFIAWEDNAAVDPSEEHALRVNLQDYKTRLNQGSVVLPDPFTLKEGWLNEQGRLNWPSLYFNDIATYLKMTTPTELYHRLCNEYKQGKAYRYFTAGLVKEVHFHPVNDQSEVAFLAAKVGASMRFSSHPHEAWVCVKKDRADKPGGEIITAYCTCTAGLKGCCNHVAAVLFRVEYAVRTGLTKPTSTSQKCVWDVPGGSVPSNPIKLCEQTWKKDQYFNQDDGSHSRSVKNLAKIFSPLTKRQEDYVSRDIKSDLANLLRQHAPDSCFQQLYDQRPFPTKKKTICPPCPQEVAINLGHPTTVENLVHAMSLSEDEIQNLQQGTLGQSDNDEWMKQRIGRITASNFHRVYTRTKTLNKDSSADPTPLIKSLMGYNPQPVTKSIKHGKSMEPHAKRAYKKIQSKLHRKFKTEECGLTIHKQHPFLGASPDLVVSCECRNSCCGDKGLCEIKCPESIKDQTPTAANYPHLVTEDGVTCLSKSSQYFCQIQGQMAVLNISYCDFFVYTSHGHHLERIAFDRQYWDDVEKRLIEFWWKYLAPELIYGTLAANTAGAQETSSLLDHTYIISSSHRDDLILPSTSAPLSAKTAKQHPLTKPKLPLIYLCGKCGEDIKDDPIITQDESVECSKCNMWFHAMCANIKDISVVTQTEWLCYNCQ